MRDSNNPWFVRIRFQFMQPAVSNCVFGPFHERPQLSGFLAGLQLNPEIHIEEVTQSYQGDDVMPPPEADVFIPRDFDSQDNDDYLVAAAMQDDPRFRALLSMGIE